jgi:hypothetical protein
VTEGPPQKTAELLLDKNAVNGHMCRFTASDFPFVLIHIHGSAQILSRFGKLKKKKKKRNIFMRDSYAPVPEIVCTKKKKNIKELGITFPPSALCSGNPSFARPNLPIIELVSQSWYTKADLRLTSQVELHCSLHNPPV